MKPSETKLGLVGMKPYSLSNAATKSTASEAAAEAGTNRAEESPARPELEPNPIIPREYDRAPPATHIPSPIAPDTNPRLPEMTEIGKVTSLHVKLGPVAMGPAADEGSATWREPELDGSASGGCMEEEEAEDEGALAGGSPEGLAAVKEEIASSRSQP